MRERCNALKLPIISGHGDLKPSNVMHDADSSPDITFIDFELAGRHYRGYDLFKLFRTGGAMSRTNMRSFLREYLAACKPNNPQHSAETIAFALDELEAEAYASEPLTWLEAAVFFLFAVSVYPSQSKRWIPLAIDRWESYLACANTIDADGAATRALLSARAKRGDGSKPPGSR